MKPTQKWVCVTACPRRFLSKQEYRTRHVLRWPAMALSCFSSSLPTGKRGQIVLHDASSLSTYLPSLIVALIVGTGNEGVCGVTSRPWRRRCLLGLGDVIIGQLSPLPHTPPHPWHPSRIQYLGFSFSPSPCIVLLLLLDLFRVFFFFFSRGTGKDRNPSEKGA